MPLIAAALFIAGLTVDYIDYFLHHGRLYGVTYLLRLDDEGNLPSLYQALSLALSAFLMVLIGKSEHGRGSALAPYWRQLAGVFVVLALDEWLSLHELIIEPIHKGMGTSGPFLFAWVIPALVALPVFGAYFFRFFLRLPRSVQNRMLLAGAVYLFGTLGMEMISGVYATSHGVINWTFAWLTDIEELIEMLGATLWLQALLLYGRQIPAWNGRLTVEWDR